MRRWLVPALALGGLLTVASAAAAINLRVLQDVSVEPVHTMGHPVGGMMTLRALPTPIPTQTAIPSASADATQPPSASAEPSNTANPRIDPTDDPWPRHRPMGPRMERPPLTVDQMNVLRVAALAHVRPDVVLAVARGDMVPELDAQAVREAADYMHIDLAALAAVTEVPRMRERGHGGPNPRGDGRNTDY